jgi:hypothetical protein
MANLHETAGTHGEDAETYVHTSIVNPNAYVSEGYMAGIMPQNLARKNERREIDGLVAWLLNPDRVR